MKPGAHITKVDLQGLRLALQVLRSHGPLIDASAFDLGAPAVSRSNVIAALYHIVTEDFRSEETRSSS